MATKTLTITEEAYDRLDSLKNGKDSFSDVITRITGKVKLSSFHGIIGSDFAGEIEANIRKSRDAHKRLRAKRTRAIVEALE